MFSAIANGGYIYGALGGHVGFVARFCRVGGVCRGRSRGRRAVSGLHGRLHRAAADERDARSVRVDGRQLDADAPVVCPGALAGTTRDVDFWKCAGDSVDRNCERADGTFDEFWRLRNMKDCAADAERTNSENRLAACLPCRDDGEMPHLRRQFPWVQSDRSDEPTVRPCGVQRDDTVEFSDVACWYDADDPVFLKT